MFDEIFSSIKAGETQEVIELLANRKNEDIRDVDGFTPLHWAAMTGNKELTEKLILNGAIINTQNNNGELPFHLAAWCGHYDLVKLFLLKGINANQPSNKGIVALQGVAIHLLYPGEDPNALRYRIGLKIAKLLVTYGANINHKNESEMTLLNWSVSLVNIELIKFLLENRADTSIANDGGFTPLQLTDKYYTNCKVPLEKKILVQSLLAPYVINNFNAKSDIAFLLKNVNFSTINLDLIIEEAARICIISINQLLDSKLNLTWLTEQRCVSLSKFADDLINKKLYPGLIDAINNITDEKNFHLIKIAILADSTMFGIADALDLVTKLYEENLLSSEIATKLSMLREKIEPLLARYKFYNIPKPIPTEQDVKKISILVEPLHYSLMRIGNNYSKTAAIWQRKRVLEKFSDIEGYPVKDKIRKINLSSNWTHLSFSTFNGKPRKLVELHQAKHAGNKHYSTIVWNHK